MVQEAGEARAEEEAEARVEADEAEEQGTAQEPPAA